MQPDTKSERTGLQPVLSGVNIRVDSLSQGIQPLKSKFKAMKSSNAGCINSNLQSNKTNSTPQFVAEPFLNFNIQDLFLDKFVATFNEGIRSKRLEAKRAGKQTSGEDFQFIKETHFNLMKGIVRAAARQMIKHNEEFQEKSVVNFRRYQLGQPYHLFTNNMKLSDNPHKRCSDRAVRDQIQRLKTVGFILEKKNHGTRADFELLINPEFLLVFDKKNPEFVPTSSLLGEAGIQGLQSGLRKILPPPRKIRLASFKVITGVDKVSLAAYGSTLTPADGSQPADGSLILKASTPENEAPEKNKQGARAENSTENSKPAPVHHRYIFEQLEIFLRIALIKLWPDRTIFPEVVQATRILILNQYFGNCQNERQADAMFQRMYWIMENQSRWRKKSPDRFIMLPLQFFDLKRKTTKKDFSGMSGGMKLYQERMQDQNRKVEQSKSYQNRLKFRKAIAQYQRAPSVADYMRLESFVKNNMPQFIPDLLELTKNGLLTT